MLWFGDFFVSGTVLDCFTGCNSTGTELKLLLLFLYEFCEIRVFLAMLYLTLMFSGMEESLKMLGLDDEPCEYLEVSLVLLNGGLTSSYYMAQRPRSGLYRSGLESFGVIQLLI